jgi:omega-amidase
MKIKISLAQTHIQFADPHANLEKAIHFISKSAALGSQFILFPELWSSGFDLANTHDYARQNKILLENLSIMAKDLKIAVGGSLLLEENGQIYNTFTILSPEGKITARYNKIHLFHPMQEHESCQPGDHLQTVDLSHVTAGLAICYDIRFPELFRSYALKGTSLFFIPAQWPLKRIEHWKLLIRARAVENLSFVVAVNCAGKIGDDYFGGSSAVISPWGETLVEGSELDEELLQVEIDLDQIARARRGITALEERRPDIYAL